METTLKLVSEYQNNMLVFKYLAANFVKKHVLKYMKNVEISVWSHILNLSQLAISKPIYV